MFLPRVNNYYQIIEMDIFENALFVKSAQAYYNQFVTGPRVSLLIRLFSERGGGAFYKRRIAQEPPYVNENVMFSVRTTCRSRGHRQFHQHQRIAGGRAEDFGPKRAAGIGARVSEDVAVCLAYR